MISNNVTLGDILNSPNQYIIPVFQRYYRWDRPEWAKLWDSLAGLQRPEKSGRHFPGFLVLVPETPSPGKLTTYYLIDGQQRLTTLSLILAALRDVARSSGLAELADEIAFTHLMHPFQKAPARYRLYPKQGDRDPFVAAIKGESAAEGRIASAVRYFQGRLAAIPGAGTEDGLRAFFALLTRRLEFVYARLDGENPFHIFKSLNSTGVPLGPADLIRNFLFMQVPVEDQEALNDDLWKPVERRFQDAVGNLDAERFSSFFRDFLMQDGAYVPPNQTFEAFQDRYASTDFDAANVAAGLKRAAEWYSILLGQEKDPDAEVEAALASHRQLESSTTHSLLLNLYRRRHAGQLDAAGLASSIRRLAGFLLRRLVCVESSRNYSRLFVQANAEIGNDPAGDVLRFLESRGFPDTTRFARDFVRFDLYHSRYRKVVLEAIERSHGHKEPAELAKAQVEHVMPQTLNDAWRELLGTDAEVIHQEWLHSVGNLTLTRYNPELGNRPFAEKKEKFEDSHYVITKSIHSAQTWGEAEIRQRAYGMAQRAALIWPGPDAPPARERYGSKPTKTGGPSLRMRFWAGLGEHVAASGSTLKLQAATDYHALRCGQIDVGLPLLAYAQPRKNEITICAWFGGKKAAQKFHEFQKHRDAIEEEIGAKLQWTSNPPGNSFVVLYPNTVDLTQENLWPSYFDWMRRTLESFRHAFGSRLPQPKSGGPPVAEELSATQRFQVEYWTALGVAIVGRNGILTARKPAPQAWLNFSVGRSGFDLAATIHKTKRWIDVSLVLQGSSAKSYLRMLAESKPEIEAEIGEGLTWREMPDSIQSQIRLTRPDVNLDDRSAWPEQHAWFVEKLEAFHKVFSPRVKELKVEQTLAGPAPD